jgi:hypothetical protein
MNEIAQCQRVGHSPRGSGVVVQTKALMCRLALHSGPLESRLPE